MNDLVTIIARSGVGCERTSVSARTKMHAFDEQKMHSVDIANG